MLKYLPYSFGDASVKPEHLSLFSASRHILILVERQKPHLELSTRCWDGHASSAKLEERSHLEPRRAWVGEDFLGLFMENAHQTGGRRGRMHLIDIIWTIDAQLDEVIFEARAQQSSQEQAQKAKEKAEGDKEKLQSTIKRLLEYGVLNPTSCRERLDTTLLVNVGLISDKGMFDKEIRTRTGLFYKQNKFNLLREQSEGYSKLTTEITSNLGPLHSPQTGLPTELRSVIESRARPVWEKVISLTGYSDLDPNRAPDIILDVLSTHLATHYSFFLALLSCPPWASQRQDGDGEPMAVDSRPDLALFTVSAVFRNQRSNSEKPPHDCAIDSGGLYHSRRYIPSPSPPLDDMAGVQKEYDASIKSRIAGAEMNALAMAAPLESGSAPKQKAQAPAEAAI
ncbi:hypothetical protein NMY22_g15763 [Coprinellus aureogranulatus]|nr:hypothetical protein NMY22_g15763 [Coprinellus aureogranulatus]